MYLVPKNQEKRKFFINENHFFSLVSMLENEQTWHPLIFELYQIVRDPPILHNKGENNYPKISKAILFAPSNI